MSSGGWWGVAFAAGLLVVSTTVSLPTAAQSGEEIEAFYHANRQIIIAQQVVEVLLLVPWLGFTVALDRRARAQSKGRIHWHVLAGLLLATIELATNLLPLALAAMTDALSTTAHTLTLLEDLADAALFVSIAFFSLVVARAERSWVGIVGLVVAALTLLRAVASPLGVTAFDAAAPIAFLAFVLMLSARILATDRARRS